MCRGFEGCDLQAITKQGFRSAIEEQSYTMNRLKRFAQELKAARDILEHYDHLWLVDPALNEAMQICQTIFDDSMCSAFGLLNEPGGLWNMDP